MATKTFTPAHAQAAIIHAALAKGAKLDREALESHEGEILPIDAVIHVRGELSVGESCMTTQVNKLCPWKLALAALNRLNGASIAAVVREASELDADATKPLKQQVTAASEQLLGTVRQRRAGAVKFNGLIEEVEP